MSNLTRGPVVTSDECGRVLAACSDGPRTVAELAHDLKRGQDTVRALLNGMMWEGLVTRTKMQGYAERRWTYVYEARR